MPFFSNLDSLPFDNNFENLSLPLLLIKGNCVLFLLCFDLNTLAGVRLSVYFTLIYLMLKIIASLEDRKLGFGTALCSLVGFAV